jgi:hypothetical protein
MFVTLSLMIAQTANIDDSIRARLLQQQPMLLIPLLKVVIMGR